MEKENSKFKNEKSFISSFTPMNDSQFEVHQVRYINMPENEDHIIRKLVTLYTPKDLIAIPEEDNSDDSNNPYIKKNFFTEKYLSKTLKTNAQTIGTFVYNESSDLRQNVREKQIPEKSLTINNKVHKLNSILKLSKNNINSHTMKINERLLISKTIESHKSLSPCKNSIEKFENNQMRKYCDGIGCSCIII